MKIISQPKTILLIISLMIIIYCLLNRNATLDIHLHDTFFVIDNLAVAAYLGGFLLLQSFIYQLTDKYKQWRSMQHIHVISTLLILLGSFFYRNYQPGGLYDFNSFYRMYNLMTAFVLFFALGQILFIVNVTAGFIRGKKVLNRNR